MLVTIRALDPVNIVRTVRVGVARVHLLHVNSAVRHLWMAGLA